MNTNYKEMNQTLKSLTDGVLFDISNYSNASALLWENLENINWAGFYILRNGHLELGPFQGKPACTIIEIGKGVCGTSVLKDKTIVVQNVHTFKGHIACDSASNSEIVVPIHKDGAIIGVLDIDSPTIGRFNESDAEGLENFVHILEESLQI